MKMTKAELEAEVERCRVIINSDTTKLQELTHANRMLRAESQNLALLYGKSKRELAQVEQDRDRLDVEVERLSKERGYLLDVNQELDYERIKAEARADALIEVIDRFIGGEK